MIMLHKSDIDPYCDTTFILLNVTELLRDFWTQNKVIIVIKSVTTERIQWEIEKAMNICELFRNVQIQV